MKFSVNWLREFVALPDKIEELAELLTLAGVEIEAIAQTGANIDKIIVARITAASQHPNADRLTVCQVDDSSGQMRQIVCGATNYKVGDKVALALPGTPLERGSLHPLTQMLDRAITIFRRMGFALADGPDIETEWHCFDALNTPPDHPARNEQDTFYLPDGRLLRTHTSTVQIRTMESAAPPIRVIAPGAAYRRDEVDATHSAQFHQIEGLYVDKNVSVADLKGALEFFMHELFGPDTAVRFRPHYFPFTEPSFEIDVQAKALKGGEQWIEVAGSGIVHPAVFEEVNNARGDNAYDPGEWTGYAFGLGMDRLAMILFDIPDIRLFAQNDLRFLRQFA